MPVSFVCILASQAVYFSSIPDFLQPTGNDHDILFIDSKQVIVYVAKTIE